MSTASGKKYSPSDAGEVSRLALQADMYRSIDQRMFTTALAELPSEPLGINFGCAHGYLTVDRFSNFGSFGAVIGVDSDQQALAQAVDRAPSNWKFIHLSGQDPVFPQVLKMAINDFDNQQQPLLFFSALTLLHLDNPEAFLADLRTTLPPGSKLLIRTADDGPTICYPDSAVDLKAILYPSVPDSTGGDRHHGRKLFQQLHAAGYQQIETFAEQLALTDLSATERQAFFEISFAWRADGLQRLIADGRASEKEVAEFSDLQRELAALEQKMQERSFFLAKTVFGALATVP